jgi:hypothetical protein
MHRGKYLLTTSSGLQVPADMVFNCTGGCGLNTLPGVPVNSSGICVLPTLQVIVCWVPVRVIAFPHPPCRQCGN